MNPEQIESIAKEIGRIRDIAWKEGNHWLYEQLNGFVVALTELDESHKAELEISKRVQGHLADHAKCLSEELAAKDAKIKEERDAWHKANDEIVRLNGWLETETMNREEFERLEKELAETKAKLAEAEIERDGWYKTAQARDDDRCNAWDEIEALRAQLLAQQDLNAKLREALTKCLSAYDPYCTIAAAALAMPCDQTLMEREDTLAIDEWFGQQCNGDREHWYGIVIRTTDNPGWFVEIELELTAAQRFEAKAKEDGLEWEAYDGTLYGYCKIGDLQKLLSKLAALLAELRPETK